MVHGRMFAPAVGVAENPVTGDSNGPLGVYLIHYKAVNVEGSQFILRRFGYTNYKKGEFTMILSGKEIIKHLGKDITIEPFNINRVNPNSYNLTLANELLVYQNDVLDMKAVNETNKIIIPEDGLLLQPIYYIWAARMNTPRLISLFRCWRAVPPLAG